MSSFDDRRRAHEEKMEKLERRVVLLVPGFIAAVIVLVCGILWFRFWIWRQIHPGAPWWWFFA